MQQQQQQQQQQATSAVRVVPVTSAGVRCVPKPMPPQSQQQQFMLSRSSRVTLQVRDHLQSAGQPQPLQFSNEPPMRTRRPNFSLDEVSLLVADYEKFLGVMRDQSNSHATAQMKREAWRLIARHMNQQLSTMCPRTPLELKKKWRNLVMTARKEHSFALQMGTESSLPQSTLKIVELAAEDEMATEGTAKYGQSISSSSLQHQIDPMDALQQPQHTTDSDDPLPVAMQHEFKQEAVELDELSSDCTSDANGPAIAVSHTTQNETVVVNSGGYVENRDHNYQGFRFQQQHQPQQQHQQQQQPQQQQQRDQQQQHQQQQQQQPQQQQQQRPQQQQQQPQQQQQQHEMAELRLQRMRLKNDILALRKRRLELQVATEELALNKLRKEQQEQDK